MKKLRLLLLFGFVCQWTLAQSPIPAPTLSNITTSSIQVTWTPAPNTTYELERSAGGSRYSVVHEVRTGSQEIQPEQTFVSNGLSAGTQYCFRLRLKGTSVYSGVACATTPTPPAAPPTPTLSDVSTSSIRVRWTTVATRTYELEQRKGNEPFSVVFTETQPTNIQGNTSMTFVSEPLSAGTEYCFRVRIKEPDGTTSAYSGIACATTLSYTPTDVVATAVSSSQIDLTWKAPNGKQGDSYQVYRADTPGGNFQFLKGAGINANGTGSYSDQGLIVNKQYCYRVRRYSAPGSDLSSEACATTLAFVAVPEVPQNVMIATSTTSSITIFWSHFDGGLPATFEIEQATSSAGPFTKLADGFSQKQYTHANLPASTQYCYRVRAKNNGPYSAFSPVVCGSTKAQPVAASPTLTAQPVSPGQINLIWNSLTGVTGYQLERSLNGTDNWAKINEPAAAATTYSDQSVSAGMRYYYRIRSFISGTALVFGPYSNVADATTPKSPSPITNLKAQAVSTTSIKLTWDKYGKESGIGIERRTGQTGRWVEVAKTLADGGEYTDTGLNPNTDYCYRIAVFEGASDYSNVVCAQTPDAPPVAPIRLSASATSFNQINLQWGDVSDNEAGFEIERSPNGTDSWAKVADVGANTTTYSNPNLSPRTRYYYRIRAVNAAGPSPYSNVADATTPDAPPAAPAQLTATPASNSQINLQWTDGSDNETGFELERSADGTNWIKIADVPANTTVFSNTGLTPDTRYYYRIRAVNAVGLSAYSNVADVTTPDVPPSAPGRLTATAVSVSQIKLTWSDESRNESGFEVERSSSQTGMFTKIADVSINTTIYVDTNLTDDTQYCYRIRAKNAAGVSGYTDVICATTPLAPPAAPTDLTAQVFDYDQIRLTWPSVSPKAVTVSIERSTDPNGGFTEIKQQPAQTTGYVDVGLREHTTYYYRIRATNAAGYSAYSNVASARVEEIVIAVEDELETHTTFFVNQRALHIVTNWYATATTSIQLLTPTGQVVLTDRRKVNPADRWSYSLDALPTGLYIIHIIADGRRLAKRIVLP